MSPESSSARLHDYRVIYVAPPPGAGGIGDYAADIVREIRRHGVNVVVPPTSDGPPTLRSLLTQIRHIRRAASTVSHPRAATVVHYEIGSHTLVPFWALARMKGVQTATIHDPPRAVWSPLRLKAVANRRLVDHALHYPLRVQWAALETAVLRKASLFCLTESGVEALQRKHRNVTRTWHYVPTLPALPPTDKRPLSIGLYGYYHQRNGKGFEHLPELRSLIPPSVGIEVAGRGTRALPALDGVNVRGELDAQDEMEFFASIRALVLPYDSGSRYGPVLSASGAAARAYAYRTPVVATAVRSFIEEARNSDALIVRPSIREVAASAVELISNRERLARATRAAQSLAASRTPELMAAQMMARWRELL